MGAGRLLRKPASDPGCLAEACRGAQRILLVMTDLHIGNFAISTPVIKAIQRSAAARGAEAHCMVNSAFVPLAQRLLDPANILPLDPPGGLLSGPGAVLRFRRLTRGRYDLLLALSGGDRGATLARCSGVPTTVGLDTYRRSAFYALRLRDTHTAHHMSRYAQFAACFGEDIQPIIEPYTPLAGDDDALRRALEDAGIDPAAPLTVIHPGAGKPHRVWPPERFALVADHAIEEQGHTVAVLTAPSEESTTAQLLGAMRRNDKARRLALPLSMLLPLFDHAGAIVCNESGPMHLAAMTRCAIVALYGPTDPAQWAPIRTGPDVIALRRTTDITSIEPGDVITAFEEALAARIPAPQPEP
ncbi:MAG: glycosyltransferase family 9 protein [Phycisphaeraceae bacterium]|nr:glycosyltransferase family 9 protein [Phycisphaeraceae bacterium]MCB9848378.1 glycosyltransferase family 9 protein [Phycisphaeraceae bacterium]